MHEDEQPVPQSQKLIYRELFSDRLLVSLIAIALTIVAAISARVLLAVKSYDIDIPVRYTQFGDVDSYISGDWFSHYNFITFGVVIFLINSFIALRIYRHRRWASISILSFQLIILIFLFVISGAIINTLPVAA